MGSPPFLVILCGHISVFYIKASEIKHVNFVVDILVYDELTIKLMFGFKMKLGLGNKVLLPEYGQKKVLIERSCQAWVEFFSLVVF